MTVPDRKSQLLEQYQCVVARVREAERRAGRAARSVQLLPVSKTFPAADVAVLADAGVTAFGESYVQEAEAKIADLSGYPLQWHFIGPIQSNKTQAIARLFHWVHSVDREKIARRLNDQRPAALPPLNICLQLNISGERSKSGLAMQELAPLVAVMERLPRLRWRGLMAIPAPEPDYEKQLRACRRLRDIYDELRAEHPALDTLSMGMSGDLEAAIAAGATIVRVGRDIFGARPPK